MKKNVLQTIIVILLVVLIAMFFGFGVYYIADNKNNNDISNSNNTDSIEDNDNISDNVVLLDVTDQFATYLYKSVELDCVNFFDEMDTYYLSDSLIINNLPNEIKMRLTALNSKYTDSSVFRNIKEIDFIETYKKLFGSDSNYIFEPISSGILEKNNEGNILFLTQGACGPYGFNKKIVKIENNKTKNEYYIYDKVAYYDVDKWLDSNIIDVYSDNNHSKLLFTEKFDFDLIWDKLPSYKHTFKSNDDGTYYFYSVEKIK